MFEEEDHEEEEIVSELEESVASEDDERENKATTNSKNNENKAPISQGKLGGNNVQPVTNTTKSTFNGSKAIVHSDLQLNRLNSQKSGDIYPLSPYKDSHDGIEEQDEEYSASFYPANESTQLNQSVISIRSKLSTKSNKVKKKFSKDEEDYSE